MDYDTGWRNSSFGKHLALSWQIRKYFISLSDEKMNTLIQSAAQMDLENFSTLKLIKEIMKRNPALVAEAGGADNSRSFEKSPWIREIVDDFLNRMLFSIMATE